MAATDYRLETLKPYASIALPRKYAGGTRLRIPITIDVFPCEYGHAQEPSLCESVLQTVKADRLWIADRNMCTQGFLFGISTASSDFLIREHKTLPQPAISELQFQGDVQTKAVE